MLCWSSNSEDVTNLSFDRLLKDLPNGVNRLSARSYKSELEIGEVKRPHIFKLLLNFYL